MKFVEASVEEIKQREGLMGVYEAIETAGKICTNSDIKGGEKAINFVDRMVNSEPQHGRPLEFGTIYLKFHWWNIGKIIQYIINPYSKVNKWTNVTTNYRVLVENGWLSDICDYMTENNKPSKNHLVRRTLHWTISRVQADSFRTHCSLSSLMQSTRYCNYSKVRFGNHVLFALPRWVYNRYKNITGEELENISDSLLKKYRKQDKKFDIYCSQLESEEQTYFKLLKETEDGLDDGLMSQDARGVLGLDVKTEFIQCGFEDAWKHFFYLRVEKAAHPDAQYIAEKAEKVLGLERKY